MTGEVVTQDVAEMSSVMSTWLHDVGRLLHWVERVVENSEPSDDAPAEVRALLPMMLPMIRECRAQVPSSEMIEAWLRSVAEHRDNVGA